MIDEDEIMIFCTSSLGKCCWRLALAQCACRTMVLSGFNLSVKMCELSKKIMKLTFLLFSLPFVPMLSTFLLGGLPFLLAYVPLILVRLTFILTFLTQILASLTRILVKLTAIIAQKPLFFALFTHFVRCGHIKIHLMCMFSTL